jgi:hypothetical protein
MADDPKNTIKVELVHNWRFAWRFFSMQAMAINTAFLATWAVLPDDIKSALPSWLVPVAAVFLLVVGMAGRIIKQPEKP